MSLNKENNLLYTESLEMHESKPTGKVGLLITKPLHNQRDLALAYSPGVAAPCLAIEKDKDAAFKYTSKGNTVAVISNGTAVLGLGDIGPQASKPVMEGKCVLFKRFADVDAVDIQVDTKDPYEFVSTVSRIADTWGGINLEDIKAPECFLIEAELKKLCKVPVFHDDQHGTAIIAVAAMINALDLTERKFDEIKIVASGAGAAAIACLKLLIKMGVKKENITMCDTKGVIYKGRIEGMNQWKEDFTIETNNRTIAEAMVDADVFLGLSTRGTISKDMVRTMASNPIIFAMANPEPEITPDEVKAVRDDAIIATGRSDYNNQVNNVMGFPYIFRGALDVQATTINTEMQIAAAHAIAAIARKETTAEVEAAYSGRIQHYSPEYIIPVPFDSRLMHEVPIAVAKAAMETGVARKPIGNFNVYKKELQLRLNPGGHILYSLNNIIMESPRTMIFVEGEEIDVIKAAIQWRNQGCGKAILIGYEDGVKKSMQHLNMTSLGDGIEVTDAGKIKEHLEQYINHLYNKLQRHGFLYRDCMRLVKRDRHIFAAEMLVHGAADAMITGMTRDYINTLNDILKVIEVKDDKMLFTLSVLMKREKIVFIADTAVHENPTPEQIADIAIQAAEEVRSMGYEPRVALISASNFGHPHTHYNAFNVAKMRMALDIMQGRELKFEYDGEMSPDIALSPDLLRLYPFCKLSCAANVLVMPDLQTANISVKLLEEFGGCQSMGPIICGLQKPVHIIQMGANSAEVFDGAVVAGSRA